MCFSLRVFRVWVQCCLKCRRCWGTFGAGKQSSSSSASTAGPAHGTPWVPPCTAPVCTVPGSCAGAIWGPQLSSCCPGQQRLHSRQQPSVMGSNPFSVLACLKICHCALGERGSVLRSPTVGPVWCHLLEPNLLPEPTVGLEWVLLLTDLSSDSSVMQKRGFSMPRVSHSSVLWALQLNG